MRIGACASETNWSVRGWMSEEKYNSRSVDLVDALVRLHSNILLEPRLDVFEGFGVPWDLDCSIEDPPSDEPERRRSRRLSGEAPDAAMVAPAPAHRVFVGDENEEGDDPFGDPEADLALEDSDDDA